MADRIGGGPRGCEPGRATGIEGTMQQKTITDAARLEAIANCGLRVQRLDGGWIAYRMGARGVTWRSGLAATFRGAIDSFLDARGAQR